MEVLTQEAYILIYGRSDALQNMGIEQLADQRAATGQPGTVIHSGAARHHSDIGTSPLSGLEVLTSLPHHRPAIEDQPSESEKCRSDDQPSETEKNKSGYAEQRPVQDGSTHKEQ
jgi:hypothetical protein